MEYDQLQKPCSEFIREVRSLLSIDQTVDEAIKLIRETHSVDRSTIYFFVVDDRGKLLGVIRTRELLTSAPDTPIRLLINTKVQTIGSHYSMYSALMLMQKYHLLALPVVEKGKLVGILDVQNYLEESIELSSSKRRWELFQTLGISDGDGPKLSTWKKYRYRAPWIFCNMLGGLACAVISDLYEVVLLKVIVLAMFIPLVLSLSESISLQAMSQSMSDMRKHLNFWKQSFHYVLHEAKLFFLISITCGLFVGFLSLLWGDGFCAGIVIGASIMISIMVTAIIGTLVPRLLHVWKLDPKIAAGPVVLMFADVITTLIYLSLGFWFLINR